MGDPPILLEPHLPHLLKAVYGQGAEPSAGGQDGQSLGSLRLHGPVGRTAASLLGSGGGCTELVSGQWCAHGSCLSRCPCPSSCRQQPLPLGTAWLDANHRLLSHLFTGHMNQAWPISFSLRLYHSTQREGFFSLGLSAARWQGGRPPDVKVV